VVRVCLVAPYMPPEYAGGGAQAITMASVLPSSKVKAIGIAGTHMKASKVVYALRVNGVQTLRVYRPRDCNVMEALSYVFRMYYLLFHLRRAYDVIHFVGVDFYPHVLYPLVFILRKRCVAKVALMGTDDPLTLQSSPLGCLKVSILKRMDAIVALTDEIEESLLAVGIRKRIVRIANGVDSMRFCPATRTEAEAARNQLGLRSSNVIAYLGIVSYRKGIDLLIDAVDELHSEGLDFVLIVTGPCDKNQNPLVDEELTRKLMAPERAEYVTVTGLIDDPSIVYKAATVFVLPSQREGMSNALLEAMSSGLASVVRTGRWLKGIGQDGLHYLSFEDGSNQSLSQRIRELLKDSELRACIGQGARALILQKFSIGAVSEEYTRLYERLAGLGSRLSAHC